MTKEEALKILRHEMQTHIASEVELHVAMGMAIEALQAADADGCDGCKYVTKDEYEMPCLVCKRNHMDKWRPCE